jgi:hypothetical protein
VLFHGTYINLLNVPGKERGNRISGNMHAGINANREATCRVELYGAGSSASSSFSILLILNAGYKYCNKNLIQLP